MLNRRAFLGAGLAAASAAQAQQPRKPNIIAILADDLGYGDLSCYGNTRHKTPHLDRMAKEGVRFTDFYTPMPFCAPTRSSLLTGRYPFRTGMTGNPAPDAGLNFGMQTSEITLAQALKKQGYQTLAIGKWHLGHSGEFLPTRRGFDEYLGILYSNDMRPVQLVHNERVVEYPVAQSELTRKYTAKALEFIEANRARPFFLYLPHAMPHKPLAASEDFYTPDTPGDLYSDVIRELDWSVGQVLEKVKALGIDNDTLILFTSDNGPWYGGQTGGLRGMKGRSWDGGIRVPMIARWPGRVAADVVTKELAGIIDIFPTAVAAAGAEVPKDRVIDGKNLLPMLANADGKSPHEALFAMSGAQLAIVRSGKWKLHYRDPGRDGMLDNAQATKDWVDPRGPDGVTLIAQTEQARPATEHPGVRGGVAGKAMLLFDVEADPGEQRDVSDSHPDVVKRLKGLFEKLDGEVPRVAPGQPGSRRILRLKGGALRYDLEAKP
ncbi:MAG: sulfatase [Bryobacterales bacterium]|nr:sulfatase [Bryobacterales bacterium]